jgi:hypothetical protein
MTAQSQTSRRLFLAAGSAATVFGALTQAVAQTRVETDPIFAAIERHKAAEVRYCAACNLTDEVAAQNEDRVVTAEDHAEFTAAQLNSDDALDAFLSTPPMTVAGVRAFLRHCVDEESIEHFVDEALETLLRSPVLTDVAARS